VTIYGLYYTEPEPTGRVNGDFFAWPSFSGLVTNTIPSDDSSNKRLIDEKQVQNNIEIGGLVVVKIGPAI